MFMIGIWQPGLLRDHICMKSQILRHQGPSSIDSSGHMAFLEDTSLDSSHEIIEQMKMKLRAAVEHW